jgi:hypothetical protein
MACGIQVFRYSEQAGLIGGSPDSEGAIMARKASWPITSDLSSVTTAFFAVCAIGGFRK